MTVLVSKEIVLREFQEYDISDIIECMNDPKVTKFLGNYSYPYRHENAQAFVSASRKQASEKPRKNYHLAVKQKLHNKVIGGVYLRVINTNFPPLTAELTYWLNKNYWQRGFASQASQIIIEYAFSVLDMQRIKLAIDSKNSASLRLAQRLGFQETLDYGFSRVYCLDK